MNVLEASGLRVRYGAIEAVKGVDFAVGQGQIVAILGANGAGKSSTMRALAGLKRPAAGRIRLGDDDITDLAAHARVERGIALVPEGRQVFATMTVEENLRIGGFSQGQATVRRGVARAYASFPILAERRRQLAGHLSGGEQQMLAVARALMAEPRLLLLDEPTLGLAPIIAGQILEIVREINRDGTSVLIVEQDAMRVLRLAAHAYVFEVGRVVLEGPGAELLHNEHVRHAYLGQAVEGG